MPPYLLVAKVVNAYLLGLILIACTSCGTLETADYRGPGKMRTPNGIGTPIGRTSIVDEVKLRWPVASPRVTQGFKPGSKRTRHQGIDLGGPKNTPILAAHDGKVIYTGRDFRGYGKLIIIENPNGFATFYAHLNSINVKEGKWVSSGDKIGAMGRTGRATGVHLHFELRIAEVAVDPANYFKSNIQANRTNH